jgi:hypothetical protein
MAASESVADTPAPVTDVSVADAPSEDVPATLPEPKTAPRGNAKGHGKGEAELAAVDLLKAS